MSTFKSAQECFEAVDKAHRGYIGSADWATSVQERLGEREGVKLKTVQVIEQFGTLCQLSEARPGGYSGSCVKTLSRLDLKQFSVAWSRLMQSGAAGK